MEKKTWLQPALKELSVKETELGIDLKTKVDGTYSDGKNTYYSFS